jgi:hypothetical protein
VAGRDLDACGAQFPCTTCGGTVRVAHTDEDARHTCGDERVGARRSLAVVRAGFEGDVDVGAAGGIAGSDQREDLGVWLSRLGVIALPHDLAIAHDHAADDGVGPRRPAPSHSERQRASEVGVIDPGSDV